MTGYHGPLPFKHSDYYFKIGLGKVVSPNEITWVEWIEIEGYEQMLLLLRMWNTYAEHPATEVKMWYRDTDKGDYQHD